MKYIIRLFRKLLRKPLRLFHRIAVPVASKNMFLAHLYYTVFSPAFFQEHHAVLAGRFRYSKNIRSESATSALLRRNTHRLEKGLIMRPRRTVFAKDYIKETVAAYELALSAYRTEDDPVEEVQWAYDVLSEYFLVTDETNPIISQARTRFRALESLPVTSDPKKPYQRDLGAPLRVNYENLLKLSLHRRSVRWYRPDTVPRELVDKAITVAGLAPSACNRQPFDYRIFDAPDKIKEVSSIPGGTAGFNHNFSGIIVVVGHLDAYFDERDRHLIYIDASLSSMALIYALEVQGISSCVINFPEVLADEKKMAKTLGLRADERVIMLVSYGYPDPEGLVPFSQKKPLSQLRSYNV